MRLGTETGFTCTCGKPGNYPNTGECAKCYKRRRRAGLPAPVAEGIAKKIFRTNKNPYSPRSDGRLSTAMKALLGEADIAYALDSHYIIAMAEAAGEAKALVEAVMAETGCDISAAIDYVIAHPLRSRRALERRKSKS